MSHDSVYWVRCSDHPKCRIRVYKDGPYPEEHIPIESPPPKSVASKRRNEMNPKKSDMTPKELARWKKNQQQKVKRNLETQKKAIKRLISDTTDDSAGRRSRELIKEIVRSIDAKITSFAIVANWF